jgi:aryl-alcohol dehydrogenase-like predicted oxidoreductase
MLSIPRIHHKPLTMHELNSCSGGCVSRKFRVRHGPHAAARLNAKPMSVAVATVFDIRHSRHIPLIPGTSSVKHLRENVAGAGLQLPHEAIKELNHAALLR